MAKLSGKFGANLKHLREERGVSQNELVRRMGGDRAYVSAIENGKKNPTLRTTEKLAKALGVSPEMLLGESRGPLKTVGIIGGLGPETTAEFYVDIVFGCYQKNKPRRPPIVTGGAPLPYRIEEELIMGNKEPKRYIPYLTAEAKRLEKAGADFIVMPCNSLHVYIKEIRNAVKVTVLSIVEETVKFIKKNNFKKAGIVSTSA